MFLIFGHDKALAYWCSRRIPHVGDVGFGPCVAIGVASGPNSEDRLLAVAVYHEWSEAAGTIQISFAAASPRWATRQTIGRLLFYPFEQLGVRKVWLAI